MIPYLAPAVPRAVGLDFQDLEHVALERVHGAGVEGNVARDQPVLQATPVQFSHEGPQRVFLAANNHRHPTVSLLDRGNTLRGHRDRPHAGLLRPVSALGARKHFEIGAKVPFVGMPSTTGRQDGPWTGWSGPLGAFNTLLYDFVGGVEHPLKNLPAPDLEGLDHFPQRGPHPVCRFLFRLWG